MSTSAGENIRSALSLSLTLILQYGGDRLIYRSSLFFQGIELFGRELDVNER